MRVNVALWDRALRFFFGLLLTAWAVAGGAFWAWIGVYLLITASWGLCPVYGILKIRTAENHERPMTPPDAG